MAEMREFESGATRNDNTDKLDFEAFLSPFVLKRYAEYLHEHRKQADGKMRAGDNWQRGIPKDEYMKSLLRHLMEMWCLHRRLKEYPIICEVYKKDMQDSICAVLFNAMGYLHELQNGR